MQVKADSAHASAYEHDTYEIHVSACMRFAFEAPEMFCPDVQISNEAEGN
jgi:hypothetical protein